MIQFLKLSKTSTYHIWYPHVVQTENFIRHAPIFNLFVKNLCFFTREDYSFSNLYMLSPSYYPLPSPIYYLLHTTNDHLSTWPVAKIIMFSSINGCPKKLLINASFLHLTTNYGESYNVKNCKMVHFYHCHLSS